MSLILPKCLYGVTLPLQITTNITSILCGKKEWKEEDSIGLSSCKPMDDKKWISPTTYRRYTGWSREKEGVHEVRSEMGLQQCQNQGKK